MKDNNIVYLDHAGATVPSKDLLKSVFDELMETQLGNPHSNGKFSSRSDQAIEESRSAVLNHFNASASDYEVVFTAGATASIKMVGECFPWSSNSVLCHPKNSHTSLLGIRGFSPNVVCIPSKVLQSACDCIEGECSLEGSSFNLLVVPGECNFSGSKANLQNIDSFIYHCCRQRGPTFLSQVDGMLETKSQSGNVHNDYPWLWLLDAAKLASTSPVNLSSMTCPPHFVAVSFYKMFGYPTGLGALLIRRDTLPLLRKRYFGGGTLLAAAADSSFAVTKSALHHSHYEDGTLNFYGIAAIRHGFKFLDSLGGIRQVQLLTHQLTRHLVKHMRELKHNRGRGGRLCTIYGRHFESESDTELMSIQGPVVTFTLCDSNGEPIGFADAERLAIEHSIQLRSGCFCNVGGCQEALGISAEEAEANYHVGRVCSDSGHDVVNGKHTGALRVSLGYSSTKEDCDYFIRFLTEKFIDSAPTTRAVAYPGTALTSGRADKTSTLPSDDPYSVEDICLYDMLSPLNLSPSGDDTAAREDSVKLSAIYVYPIKSCGGMRVNAWPLSSSGLLYDRHFALVDSSTGKTITQKMYPILALVMPRIDMDKEVMVVSGPGLTEVLVLSLQTRCSNASTSSLGESCSVSICGQLRAGVKVSSNADEWFSSYLSHHSGRSVRCSLVRCAVSSGCTDSTTISDVGFSNTAQFLLLSSSSIRRLIQLITDTMDITSEGGMEESLAGCDLTRNQLNISTENFRPNLLVSTGDLRPHQEDEWKSVSVPLYQRKEAGFNRISSVDGGKFNLTVTGPCPRCSMVNVNSSSGAMDCRAFQALSSYRKQERNVYFGQFLTISGSNNSLKDSSTPQAYVAVGCVVDVE